MFFMTMTMGPGGITISDGPGGGGGGSSKSGCGGSFDAYVIQHVSEEFPYCAFGPASRTITELWENRRLRLYKSPNDVCEGQVVSWTQWNSGPFSSSTNWDVKIKLDGTGDLEAGEEVVIRGFPKAHDGKRGEIVKRLANDKFKVKLLLEAEDVQFATVKLENLENVSEPPEFRVRRMNINGGGIVQNGDFADGDISLEWIDPPNPAPEFQQRAANASCPTCRAVEPTELAYEDDASLVTLTNHMCPICSETKLCRTLQCNHKLCSDCWGEWRKKGSSKIPSGVHAPISDPDELQKVRDMNFQKLNAVLPHTMDGDTTKALGRTRGSRKAAVAEAMEKFRSAVGGVLWSLDNDLSNDDEVEGLMGFWIKVMTMSIHLLCVEEIMMEQVRDTHDIAPVEILMHATEARSEEICCALQHSIPLPVDKDDAKYMTEALAKAHVQSLNSLFCTRIGEIYERADHTHSAIHWYERALFHEKKRFELGQGEVNQEDPDEFKRDLAMAYNNLGLAEKRAGLFNQALKNYDASVSLHAMETGINNKASLMAEMKRWTGTSGKLTPGC